MLKAGDSLLALCIYFADIYHLQKAAKYPCRVILRRYYQIASTARA